MKHLTAEDLFWTATLLAGFVIALIQSGVPW